jgi:hypothetical protein
VSSYADPSLASWGVGGTASVAQWHAHPETIPWVKATSIEPDFTIGAILVLWMKDGTYYDALVEDIGSPNIGVDWSTVDYYAVQFAGDAAPSLATWEYR